MSENGNEVVVHRDVLESVVVPGNSTNLVYFKWTVPKDSAGTLYWCRGEVNENQAIVEYFTVPLSRDTSGGNSHPSTDGHKASAEILSAYMSNKGFTDGTWGEKIEVLPALDAEKDGSGWILSWNDGLPKTKKY